MSAPAVLTVMVPVTLTRQPLDQTVAEGTSVTFTVGATGTPAPRYQWQYNGVDLPGQTNAVLSLASVTASNIGEYLAVVSNPVGAINSAPAALRISLRPGFTRQPQSQSAKLGESVRFSVTASGSEPLQYRWRFQASAVGPSGLRGGNSLAWRDCRPRIHCRERRSRAWPVRC